MSMGILQTSATPVMSVRKLDRKSTRLNSSHTVISYAVFCLKKEEHTYELQSHSDLVCRLLLEKRRAEKSGLATDSSPTVPYASSANQVTRSGTTRPTRGRPA